jgi:hypothetical protein
MDKQNMKKIMVIVIPAQAGIQCKRSAALASQTVCHRATATNSLRGKFLHSQKLDPALPRDDVVLEIVALSRRFCYQISTPKKNFAASPIRNALTVTTPQIVSISKNRGKKSSWHRRDFT